MVNRLGQQPISACSLCRHSGVMSLLPFQGDEHKSMIASGLTEVLGLTTRQILGVEYGTIPLH